MKTEIAILATDSNAARYVKNIEGWVDINNRFFGNDERAARYSSATHSKCECGALTKKGWLKCDSCRAKADKEAYIKLPLAIWDEESPVYSHLVDRYFFGPDEIEYYCEDEGDINPNDLMLVTCTQNHFSEVNPDSWEDIMPDDNDELPDALISALHELNRVIRTLPPASYSPGKMRIEYLAK